MTDNKCIHDKGKVEKKIAISEDKFLSLCNYFDRKKLVSDAFYFTLKISAVLGCIAICYFYYQENFCSLPETKKIVKSSLSFLDLVCNQVIPDLSLNLSGLDDFFSLIGKIYCTAFSLILQPVVLNWLVCKKNYKTSSEELKKQNVTCKEIENNNQNFLSNNKKIFGFMACLPIFFTAILFSFTQKKESFLCALSSVILTYNFFNKINIKHDSKECKYSLLSNSDGQNIIVQAIKEGLIGPQT